MRILADRKRRETLVVLALFLLLTTLLSWPVLRQLDSVVVGADNDAHINPWADWWTAKALRDPSLSLWETDYLFYPRGVSLVYHSFSHLNTAVSLLLRPALGPIPAYNLTILFNFVLLGLSMFHLARYLTGSSPASLLAAVIFAFNAHSLYQTAHPVIFSIWPLPWGALFLLQAVRRNSNRQALAASLFVFLAALASTLILVLMALWLGLILCYLLLTRRLSRSSWQPLATFGLVSVLSCLPLLAPQLQESVVNGNGSFIIDPRLSLTADTASPFIPRWSGLFHPDLRTRGLYFGIVPLSLVVMARHRRDARPWFLLLLVAFLLAIGPQPRWWGFQFDVILPWSLLVQPLLRNMYRMSVILSLALAMLAAQGWLAIMKSFSQRQRTLILVPFVAVILLDYVAPGFPYTPIGVSPFYTEFLQAVPDDVAVAILPTGRQEDKRYLLYQTYHGHKMTGGVVSRAQPDIFRFIRQNALLRAGAVDMVPVPIPDDPLPALRDLAAVNVGYLVFDKTFESFHIEAWRSAMPMEPFYEDDLVLVYETHVE